MRIISGFAGGRRLHAPSTDAIRPTTDRVRESLFGVLGELDDVIVVDGFAGSGALGCEAISRGAARCYFFDTSRHAIDLIKANLEVIRAEDRAVVKKTTFKRGLMAIDQEPDLILLDPPYGAHALVQSAFDAILASPMVTSGALVVLEQDIDDALPELDARAEIAQEHERVYGRTRITLWRLGEPA